MPLLIHMSNWAHTLLGSDSAQPPLCSPSPPRGNGTNPNRDVFACQRQDDDVRWWWWCWVLKWHVNKCGMCLGRFSNLWNTDRNNSVMLNCLSLVTNRTGRSSSRRGDVQGLLEKWNAFFVCVLDAETCENVAGGKKSIWLKLFWGWLKQKLRCTA